MSWYQYKRYVSVAERKEKAIREMEKFRKKGQTIHPVTIEGRKIARNFWGEAWCVHLESFGDYANRLPRGRAYVRNGSVCHLGIQKGEIEAFVSGSELYKVEISIKTLDRKKWTSVKESCAHEISSILDLLQGKIPDRVLEAVTDQQNGLFPSPKEIRFQCDCPDYASMCKHIAAVLYGVGARLDHSPELLFELRGVDYEELIDSQAGVAHATREGEGNRNRISADALGDVFGIEMDEETEPQKPRRPAVRKTAATKKKVAVKKTAAAKKKIAAKKKTTSPKKASAKKADSLAVTGREVVALRRKFGMSETEFGLLLGVSPATVSNWEKRFGDLKLRAYSLQEIRNAMKFSKKKAWAELEIVM